MEWDWGQLGLQQQQKKKPTKDVLEQEINTEQENATDVHSAAYQPKRLLNCVHHFIEPKHVLNFSLSLKIL